MQTVGYVWLNMPEIKSLNMDEIRCTGATIISALLQDCLTQTWTLIVIFICGAQLRQLNKLLNQGGGWERKEGSIVVILSAIRSKLCGCYEMPHHRRITDPERSYTEFLLLPYLFTIRVCAPGQSATSLIIITTDLTTLHISCRR